MFECVANVIVGILCVHCSGIFFRIRTVKTKKNEFFFTQNESLMMTVVSCH